MSSWHHYQVRNNNNNINDDDNNNNNNNNNFFEKKLYLFHIISKNTHIKKRNKEIKNKWYAYTN